MLLILLGPKNQFYKKNSSMILLGWKEGAGSGAEEIGQRAEPSFGNSSWYLDYYFLFCFSMSVCCAV